jgi:hypothetical protein
MIFCIFACFQPLPDCAIMPNQAWNTPQSLSKFFQHASCISAKCCYTIKKIVSKNETAKLKQQLTFFPSPCGAEIVLIKLDQSGQIPLAK